MYTGHIIYLKGKSRNGREKQLQGSLEALSIDAHLFEGCDGENPSDVGWLFPTRNILPREVGCFASHMQVWWQAVRGELTPIEEGSDWYLVFEDDAIIGNMTQGDWDSVYDKLTDDWDIVLLHEGIAGYRGVGMEHVVKRAKPKDFGLYAYAFRASKIKPLLNTSPDKPIDVSMHTVGLSLGCIYGVSFRHQEEVGADSIRRARWERRKKKAETAGGEIPKYVKDVYPEDSKKK